MEERVYFAYIVAGKSRTLYIGVTGDLRMRVYQHKQKLHPDGFAGTYNCDRLVWFERFMDPNNAIAREKQLKGWTRAKKIALIEKNNPTWEDLSERVVSEELVFGRAGTSSRCFDSSSLRVTGWFVNMLGLGRETKAGPSAPLKYASLRMTALWLD
jgi:putative endonuclease